MDSGGVSRGMYVAVPDGCLHFNNTSMALPWNFHGTSMVVPRNFHGTSTAQKMLTVLLSASVERVNVSHMRDFKSIDGLLLKILYILF